MIVFRNAKREQVHGARNRLGVWISIFNHVSLLEKALAFLKEIHFFSRGRWTIAITHHDINPWSSKAYCKDKEAPGINNLSSSRRLGLVLLSSLQGLCHQINRDPSHWSNRNYKEAVRRNHFRAESAAQVPLDTNIKALVTFLVPPVWWLHTVKASGNSISIVSVDNVTKR